jgi:outer membrane immunogenic protein
VPPTLPWTGCYVGGHIGGAWARKEFSGVTASGELEGFSFVQDMPGASLSADGWLAGVQAGCDYQIDRNWVIGIRGMFSWTDLSGDHTRTPFDPFLIGKGTEGHLHFHFKTESIATLVARLGYTWGPYMLYGVGGVAWARDKYQIDGSFLNDNEGEGAVGTTSFNHSASETRFGWVLGVGFAALLGGNWHGHVEYNYIDLGKKNVTLNGTLFDTEVGPGSAVIRADIDQEIHVIKVGLNYKFW